MRHAARRRVRRTLAAGKLDAMYFLMAASEEPLRSLRPSRAALISSEYFGPSVFVVFLAGGIVICAQKRRCVVVSVQAGSGPNSRATGRQGEASGGAVGGPRCSVTRAAAVRPRVLQARQCRCGAHFVRVVNQREKQKSFFPGREIIHTCAGLRVRARIRALSQRATPQRAPRRDGAVEAER